MKTKLKKVNITGLPPVKRFLYSHVARLFTLLLQEGKVSWGHLYLWIFTFFLGKCSIHFLCGNWNFTFPSFESITAPVVLKKGQPRIIVLEVLLRMSITIKSIGTKFIWISIITSFILPKACLVESSAGNRSISHFSIFYQDQVNHIVLWRRNLHLIPSLK
jgi:hypothetical protein